MATNTNYAPPFPTLDGNGNFTQSWLEHAPQIVLRELRTIAQQHFVLPNVLKGRIDGTGSGAFIVELMESIYADRDPIPVDQLGDYPLVTTTGATTMLAKTVKRGLSAYISDEAIARMRIDEVRRTLVKIGNSLVKVSDTVGMAAIGSAVTQTQAAAGKWDGSTTTPDPLSDVLLAQAQIFSRGQGYKADTFLGTPNAVARLTAQAVKMGVMPRETNNQFEAGLVKVIGDMQILTSPYLPSGVNGIVLDSTMLGGIGFEVLGGGYVGDPADPWGVESKTWHDDEKDAWKVQARKVAVPIVNEPGAAVIVTGIF